jgi:pantetheine-phosphate adenylyltransferase
MKSSLAVFPGSFDPVHNGHLRVLQHASDLFSRVIWAVGTNPPKMPMFTVEQRLEMMRLVNKFDNVEIASFSGLLAEFALERGASHIVRSLRVAMDFDYEYQLMLANRRIAPQVQTVYFPAEQEDIHLNSTMIRELLRLGRVLPGYMPGELAPFLAAVISGKQTKALSQDEQRAH